MPVKSQSAPVCWVVTEGLAGTENQCLGIAEALGVAPEVKRIALRQPWKALSPYLGFECGCSFDSKLEGPWPDIVIAGGRKAIAAARYIKKASGGKSFTVQIQDPRISPKNFDLVAVPAHDPARGANVIVTVASPNRVTPARLAAAKEQFAAFETIRRPRIAVLIGGTSKAYTMTESIMEKLAGQLSGLEGGLMITTSRRTGAENEKILRKALKDTDAYIWDGKSENPYFGFLAWADYILVTADSASMLSESCSTGKPVYMIPLEGGSRRLNALHENLARAGALRTFEGRLESWTYMPLRDAEMVAQAINKLWKYKG